MRCPGLRAHPAVWLSHATQVCKELIPEDVNGRVHYQVRPVCFSVQARLLLLGGADRADAANCALRAKAGSMMEDSVWVFPSTGLLQLCGWRLRQRPTVFIRQGLTVCAEGTLSSLTFCRSSLFGSTSTAHAMPQMGHPSAVPAPKSSPKVWCDCMEGRISWPFYACTCEHGCMHSCASCTQPGASAMGSIVQTRLPGPCALDSNEMNK